MICSYDFRHTLWTTAMSNTLLSRYFCGAPAPCFFKRGRSILCAMPNDHSANSSAWITCNNCSGLNLNLPRSFPGRVAKSHAGSAWSRPACNHLVINFLVTTPLDWKVLVNSSYPTRSSPSLAHLLRSCSITERSLLKAISFLNITNWRRPNSW